MKEEKHRLILDGNAFYEIDVECIKKRKKDETERKSKVNKQQITRKQYDV